MKLKPSVSETVALGTADAKLPSINGPHTVIVDAFIEVPHTATYQIRPGTGPSAHAMFYFRKHNETRPFFSSRWPIGGQVRCLIFFYHDPETLHLRMHTIRDFI